MAPAVTGLACVLGCGTAMTTHCPVLAADSLTLTVQFCFDPSLILFWKTIGWLLYG